VRRFLSLNSLSVAFLLGFLATLAGQAVAGWRQLNDEQLAEGFGRVGLADYVTSADFSVAMMENWQSEYLQFLLYILATIWLVQVGSPESKEIGKAGTGSDEDQKLGPYAEEDSPRWATTGGLRTSVFSWSLIIVMGTIFLLSWLGQSVSGWASYNQTRLEQLRDPIAWTGYLTHPDFWERTLQNWQSELLAVGSMAVLSIYLRARGSAESKPVGEPHESTGVSS
jgi:hypothetical protein